MKKQPLRLKTVFIRFLKGYEENICCNFNISGYTAILQNECVKAVKSDIYKSYMLSHQRAWLILIYFMLKLFSN